MKIEGQFYKIQTGCRGIAIYLLIVYDNYDAFYITELSTA